MLASERLLVEVPRAKIVAASRRHLWQRLGSACLLTFRLAPGGLRIRKSAPANGSLVAPPATKRESLRPVAPLFLWIAARAARRRSRRQARFPRLPATMILRMGKAQVTI